jgi:signal transduction histidine kinase
VLQFVASRLKGAIRESDTVSRHSGDEFVVLLADITQASDAALIATKMLAAVSSTPAHQRLPLSVSVSIGVAIYPDDGEDPLDLIDCADAAMYRSKRQGGAAFNFHGVLDTPAAPAGRRADASSGPVYPPAPVASGETSAADLREANEHLVLAAVAARYDLETQAAQALETRLKQARFLAVAAHELRNPLGPIRAAADLLQRGRGDEAQLERLQQIIRRQVAALSRIVDDLLDSTRVETGKFNLDMGPVDLTEVLTQVIESCHASMQARSLRFTAQLPAAPLPVTGDAVRLAQVFRNLLDNATKYTPKGGSVTLTTEIRDATVVITVADEGIGIDPATLMRVFEPYVQDPRAMAYHRGGLGIGLSVVRELVQAHGGSVLASSDGPGLGSQFAVTLPTKQRP